MAIIRKPKHVLHIDRDSYWGDVAYTVTLRGYAWERGRDGAGCGDHCRTFDSLPEARRAWAKKNLFRCDCPECVGEVA